MLILKILRTSNYDSELYEEAFVENIPLVNEYGKSLLQQICDLLNSYNPDGADYWKIVASDYVLKTGNPNA